jgi:ABC-type Na+ transport system ATPase subunit NatA
MQITFSNVISGRILDGDWRDLEVIEQEIALDRIKEVLLGSCRGESQTSKAIERMSINNLPPNMGIYNRLTTREYIAGQDYPGELNYIKQKIKSFC